MGCFELDLVGLALAVDARLSAEAALHSCWLLLLQADSSTPHYFKDSASTAIRQLGCPEASELRKAQELDELNFLGERRVL